MNRFKFRAWCILEKKGSFIYFDLEDRCTFNFEIFDQEPIFQQYTGLKDSKGNEIYEGDIVKYNPDEPTIEREGIIEWSDYYHGWAIRDKQCYPESNYGVFSLASPFMSFNDVKIIGCIFETPELLKTNE
jgi:uncharacterized phage protein (TIGR01671 family)